MASPTKKQRIGEEEVSVVGYLHNVSPIKISKKNTRYFDATIQSNREEYHRVVVFSPEKHGRYEQASLECSPVKLTKVKKGVSYGDNPFEVLCNASTKIEVAKKVPFLFRGPPKTGPVRLENVLAIGPKQQVKTIRVKILPGGMGSRMVDVNGVQRELREFNICDNSGQTKLTVWEDKIEMVEVHKSYEISNLTTRRFGEKTTLSTTVLSSITEVQDVGEPETLEASDECTKSLEICGRVLGVEVVARYHCALCHASQVELNNKDECYRCEKCRQLQETGTFSVLYGGILTVMSDTKLHKLQMTNSAVRMFVSEQLGGGVTDVDIIDRKIISVKNVQVEVDGSGLVITMKASQVTAKGVEQGEPSQRMENAQGDIMVDVNDQMSDFSGVEEAEALLLFSDDL